jgi:predicted metal-dependent hydrolase
MQLRLPFVLNEDSLRDYLEKITGKSISLKITDNSTSMISLKTKGGIVYARLHRIFLNAGNDVIEEIAQFIKNKKGRTPLIRDFIKQNSNCLNKKLPKKLSIKTQGRYYDLRDIYAKVNSEYFNGKVAASITWGTKSPRYAVRKRTLGSYSSHTNTIRINPILDKKSVPRYFIEFIVYHEMLHADMDVETKNGRRSVHSREFRRREKLFKHYERVVAWEKGNRRCDVKKYEAL